MKTENIHRKTFSFKYMTKFTVLPNPAARERFLNRGEGGRKYKMKVSFRPKICQASASNPKFAKHLHQIFNESRILHTLVI